MTGETAASYDGKVEVGGPAQTLSTGGLEITKLAVGPFDNNTYLLRDVATDTRLLIDAANEADRILQLCDGRLDFVLTTHCHLDHWQALAEVVEQTGAVTMTSEAEAAFIDVPTGVIVTDGQQIEIGSQLATAVLLTGHRARYLDHVSTSVGLAYQGPDGSHHVFTGDSLFPGGVGNTCDDPAAFSSLLNDVAHKIFGRLPDSTQVYPGHGFDTWLGIERPSLAIWANRHW